MSQSNFDNEIKKQLEGLKVEPSAGIWDKIEPRLPKKEKDRRWLLFILLIPMLLFGVYLINSFYSNKTITATTKNLDKQTDKSQKYTQKTLEEKGLETKHKDTLNSASAIVNDSILIFNKRSNSFSAMPLSKQVKSTSIIANKKKLQLDKNIHVAPAKEDQIAIREKEDQQKNDPAVVDSAQSLETTNDKNEKEKLNLETDYRKEELQNKLSNNKKEFAEKISSADSSNNSITSKKNNWHYGLQFSIGRSRVGSGFLNKSEANNDILFNTSSGGSPGFATGMKSIVQDGLFLQGGLSISKDMGKRWQLETGLHYSLYKNKILVGRIIDSVATISPYRTYGNDGSENYTSNYHYLQIPLLAKVTLNEKYPFRISAGGSFNILAASNALVYNRAANNYYTRKNLFTKSTVTLIAGLEKDFGSGSSFPLTFGVRAGYNFNSSVKTKYDQQYLKSLGIYIYFPLK